MTLEEIKKDLGCAFSRQDEGPDCPGDETLASFCEGGLADASHDRVLVHISDCDFCLERVSLVCHLNDLDALNSGTTDLSLAKSWAEKQQKGFKPRPAQAWTALAAAASVILVIGVFLMSEPAGNTMGVSGDLDVRPTRTLGADERSFELNLARGQSAVSAAPSVDWPVVPGSLYYRIRIVSDDGDLVWQDQVETTRWNPPGQLTLEAEREYFVKVDAFVSRTRTISSDFVPFIAGNRDH